MGLRNNHFRNHFEGIVEGNAHALLAGQWDAYRQFEKFIYPDMASEVLKTVADPPGFYITSCATHPPITAGEMSWRPQGEGDLSGYMYPAMQMVAALSGSGDLAASGFLSAVMVAALSGSGDLSPNILAQINASVDMVGSGDLDAGMSALANMLIEMTGTGDLDAAINAVANMSVDIVVTGAGLTVQSISNAVWNAVAASNNESGTMGELVNDVADIKANTNIIPALL